ncbi:transposon Tf2-8 polyprotein [Trichonephila clavipes]|nr:transposon Tf2-8 polyprotein [Trichonephila clavipes]
MDLFLTLFERQMKLFDLGEDLWVPYLIGALPSDATSLIAREPDEKCRDYSHIRGMLLQRFKLTAEKFRELFSRHRKSPNGTWKDYYFEIRAYFEGWLKELKIDSFDGLKNLMIADQMKKKCSPECKEHYLDIWEELISPEMLADKLEAFDNIRHFLPSGPRRYVKASEIVNDGRQETTLAMSLADGQQITGRSHLTTQGNRTLLGTDFLSSAGLVLDVKNTCWYFWDNPTHKYPFGEELDTPSIVEKMSSNTCQLREGEGESLTSVCVCAQKEKLNLLLESFQNVFEPGGEATNILEHHINTGNSPPISIPPYRMSPVKNCPDCIKYKASNQKPSGLLQTPVPAQRFETLAIDLFVPLPESKDGKRWILIIEDCTTKWVELFALPNATAKECAITLLEEVLLRYGIPRRLISDNGTEFVSAVMQQICYLLNIHQSLIPVYHPQTNPVERKNRDLKPRLAILVQDKHDCCEVVNDIQVVIQNDNFVPEITPYLKKFAKFSTQVREVVEEQQDSRKFYADKKRKAAPKYQPGENVFVASHPLSNAAQGRSAKLMPRRDGPYVILTQRSPSSCEIASLDNPGEPLGVYHNSALAPCNNDKVKPLIPLRKRGLPPKVPLTPGSSSGRRRNQRGRM